jgi:hypothetical protein
MMEDWLRRMEFNPDALAEILAHIHEYDTRASLSDIRIPTLVLAGGRDLGGSSEPGPNYCQVLVQDLMRSTASQKEY